jgi:hypothetical protein
MTILLPAWNEAIEKLKMAAWIMPRDVRTCWNSTFDMLEFMLKYRTVINAYMANRKNNLH